MTSTDEKDDRKDVEPSEVTDDLSALQGTDPDASLGSVVGGQYRLERHLGAGGFGDVYQAVQEKTKQLVALKILRPRMGKGAPSMDRQLARFRREMRACAELHHPHIVRLIDSGETDDGLLFSVFEFVPGQTLADLLRDRGALTVESAIELMSQVLDALGAAHAQGIIHRDLKPNNIMASTSGLRPQITVLDFGISAFLEGMSLDDFQSLTMTREILGTPAYAAPEQLRGETPSVKSDLYAWGLVFAECILGRAVFDGPTAMEIAHRQLSAEPVVLPERLQRHRLGTLLRWVLEKDVTRRAGDAGLVMERLREKHSLVGLVDANGYFVEADGAAPAVASAAVASPTESRLAAVAPGERRQVTAVCCMTSVAAKDPRTSPEELDRALRETQALCARVAGRFGGEVTGGFGGQVLIYFGVQRASDTDARRAAVAALEIAQEVRRMNERSPIRADFRIGIHTGLVTTAGFDQGSSAIFGVTPGRAAQLAQDAPGNGIAVSDEAARHLSSSFELRADRSLRSGPAHLLVAESRAESAVTTTSRVPFVGRAVELETLKAAWQEARGGRGRAVAIVADAGMGKSRLTRELRHAVADLGGAWIVARAFAELQPTTLGPISELLVQELDLSVGGAEGAARLERALAELGVARGDAMSLLAPWLGLGAHRSPALSPQRQKALLLGLLVDVTLAAAERKAAPLVIEDLHWADATTLEYVDLLVRKVAQRSVLVILTARPEAGAPWPHDFVQLMRLRGLDRPEVERIVRELVGRDYLAPGLLYNVVDRAEGNPFFVEEVTRFIVESSTQPTLGGGAPATTPGTGVPTKLRDILTGRLDRLGRAKVTAQVAAAIGREFDQRLLAAIMPENEPSLLPDLEKMVSADLIVRRRHVDSSIYMFRHALIRDAAYDSVPLPARRAVHERIATALETEFADVVAGRPELVAQHLTNANLPGRAVPYWQKAGQNTIAMFAHAEATAHFAYAIEQLLETPASRERSRKEIELRTEIGVVFMTTKGYSAHEVEETYRRAAELCEEVGDELPLGVLEGIWAVNLVRADPEPVARLLERFKAIARSATEPYALLIANASLQAGLFWFPKYADSIRHGEQARLHFDFANPKAQHESLLRDHGFQGLFYPHIYGAYAHTICGSFAAGRALLDEAFKLAERVGDPYALATARLFACIIKLVCGDFEAARVLADDLRASATENSFLLWRAFSQVPRGRFMVSDGQVVEGLAEINDGLGTLRAIGAMISFPIYLALYAEALSELGRLEEAEAVCLEGLSMMDERGFRAWEPVIRRTQGEIRLRKGDHAGAEAALLRSLELGREHGALAFELATAVSLVQLREAQGRGDEGRAQLAEVVARFDPQCREPLLERARRVLARG
jgi:TOMM system kinase/cyclase fusion protein